MPLAVVESSESVAVTCITDEPAERKFVSQGHSEGQSKNQKTYISAPSAGEVKLRKKHGGEKQADDIH